MDWLEPVENDIPESMYQLVGGHPLVAQRLYSLGLKTRHEIQAFLDPMLYALSQPEALAGIDIAADRLVKAIYEKEPILVWGDFDVDGQTSTSLLVSMLRRLGANVGYFIPIRETNSHGMHKERLLEKLTEGYRLVLTCDTGVSSIEEVEATMKQGVDVIITDHHDLPDDLPAALAILNPKFLPESHPMAGLPGVGVAYMLSRFIHARFGSAADADIDLDLVALGIVADLAVVTGDVRFLLQKGLELLRKGGRMGIDAILERIDVEPARINEEFIAFSLAPRLNALGRLGDANPAVELLTTTDMGRARMLVTEIESLNAQRRLLTSSILAGIETHIKQHPALVERPVIVLDGEGWHTGVIGIVASRLVEIYAKPTIVIAWGAGKNARGSARAVPGVNITSLLAKVGSLLTTYGGHPMAAGFSIPVGNIEDFRRAVYREFLSLEPYQEEKFAVDAYVSLDSLDLEFLDDVNRLAPFGPGNLPLNLAARRVQVAGVTAVGREEEHVRLNLLNKETGKKHTAIWWQGGTEKIPLGTYDLAYQVKASDYTGVPGVSIQVIGLRPVELDPDQSQLFEATDFTDYRSEVHPKTLIQLLIKQPGIEVWAEADTKKDLVMLGISSSFRHELKACEKLVIWSIPPGRMELQQAVQSCIPKKIILFANMPAEEELQAFLKRLSGIVKFAVRSRNGVVEFDHLAGQLSQRKKTVQLGIKWLAAQGYIHIDSVSEDGACIALVGEKDPDELKQTAAGISLMLRETLAFRNYYRSASLDSLAALCSGSSTK